RVAELPGAALALEHLPLGVIRQQRRGFTVWTRNSVGHGRPSLGIGVADESSTRDCPVVPCTAPAVNRLAEPPSPRHGTRRFPRARSEATPLPPRPGPASAPRGSFAPGRAARRTTWSAAD